MHDPGKFAVSFHAGHAHYQLCVLVYDHRCVHFFECAPSHACVRRVGLSAAQQHHVMRTTAHLLAGLQSGSSVAVDEVSCHGAHGVCAVQALEKTASIQKPPEASMN